LDTMKTADGSNSKIRASDDMTKKFCRICVGH
jgi:hypothetical protein